MDWKEKIITAMALLKQACGENGEWAKCAECPFSDYCDYIMESSGGLTPEEFEIPKREETK